MMNRLKARYGLASTLSKFFLLLALPLATWAQVPVDENGEVIGEFEVSDVDPATGNEDIPLLSTVDLEELVGPIALYPDDLLAVVLPAAAYPLQIVDAARFLEALEDDPTLEPDPEWDDSVVALTNYPEVVQLMNDDIDWTWRLGEAVVSQQADVVAAIESFRDRAYAAGNLKSDSRQTVSRDEGVIEITPVADDVIYVPYYEPERVVVYQPRPVYYYYPRPYPVYYYPYSSSYAFNRGYFWGVTTAFTIGWYSDSLNVFHHSYYGHPYYGHTYWDRWWYRRPTINIYNRHYVGRNTNITINHYDRGDRWRPRHDRRNYLSDRRLTRNRYYPNRRSTTSDNDRLPVISDGARRSSRPTVTRRTQTREPITFRKRPQSPSVTDRRESGDGATRQADRREDRAGRRGHRESEARLRDTGAVSRTRTETTTALRRQPQTRRSVADTTRNEASSNLRRTEANMQSRRSAPARQTQRTQTAAAARRVEPTRQVGRSETVAAVRRNEPARRARPTQTTATVRRAEPARQAGRAPTAAPVRRAESTRPAAQPQRQQKSERRKAPAVAESRQRADGRSRHRR
jgi:hypothetical protein